MFKYNFPEIKFKTDILTQLYKIEEEVLEVHDELGFNDDGVLEESIDVLLASETLHRSLVSKFGIEKVNLAIEKTILKNQSRDYFVAL